MTSPFPENDFMGTGKQIPGSMGDDFTGEKVGLLAGWMDVLDGGRVVEIRPAWRRDKGLG